MATLKGDGKAFMVMFIGAIIAVVFLTSIADTDVNITSTQTLTNHSFTAGANGTSVDLPGRSVLSVSQVWNETNGTAGFPLLLTSNNFSVTTTLNSSRTGIRFTVLDENIESSLKNITYTFEPLGYLDSVGARSVNNLIVIFGALAILVFVVVILFKESSLKDFIDTRRMK